VERFDVVVLGGGPAGLSAAARAAWVEAIQGRRALSLRVLLVEACESLGGFARWSPVFTYSPESTFTRRDIEILSGACASLGVTIVHDEVEAVTRHPDGYLVRTSRGERVGSCLILACGLKRAFDAEPILYQEGRLHFVPARSRARLAAVVQELEAKGGVREIVVYGARWTRAMREAMTAAARRARVRWVEETAHRQEVGTDTIRGRVTGMGADAAGVWLRLASRPEAEELVRGDVLFIDSDSYVNGSVSSACVGGLGLESADGFVTTDKQMRTSLPGLFAAGDVTGPPLGMAKALGEGMVAGLSAYRYVYERRFGVSPDLFPYYPSPEDASCERSR
jgi:thioredoxin reductase (NADPH)